MNVGIVSRSFLALLFLSCATRMLSSPLRNIHENSPFSVVYNAYRNYYLQKHSAALGSEDADQWRTELVRTTLKKLGICNTNGVVVKKLSHSARQELHATGYCTITGIWLYHSPSMSKELAHYIAIHEAAHYALRHPQRKYCINTLNDLTPVISACLGAALGIASKQILASCSIIKTKLIAIASTIFFNDLITFHAKRAQINTITSIEEEADTVACGHIISEGDSRILDHIITASEHRCKVMPHIQEKSDAYTAQLHKQHNLDPVWLASLHITTIKKIKNQTKI